MRPYIPIPIMVNFIRFFKILKQLSVWVLNISNMNNIMNLIANFKAMKMYLNV
jgi:hypothetical protein